MFRNARSLSWLAVLTLAVVCGGATVASESAGPPPHPSGFFETYFVVTEIICVPIFLVLLIGSMASNRTTESVETRTFDIWNRPLAKSHTTINVPKEPSSPQEIRDVVIAFCVLYPLLRLTCLCGFFNAFYRFVGGCIDIFLR